MSLKECHQNSQLSAANKAAKKPNILAKAIKKPLSGSSATSVGSRSQADTNSSSVTQENAPTVSV